MDARDDPDIDADRADLVGLAAINADALIKDGVAHLSLKQLFENLADLFAPGGQLLLGLVDGEVGDHLVLQGLRIAVALLLDRAAHSLTQAPAHPGADALLERGVADGGA